MYCEVCGQEFLVRHSCPGPGGGQVAVVPPEGFALFHYLGEAFRIIRWDGYAISRIKDDKRVLPYGIFIWALSNVLAIFLTGLYEPKVARYFSGMGGFVTLLLLLPYLAVFSLTHLGICHLLVKSSCGGDGRFIQIIRPLLLASIVTAASAVPFLGPLLAGLAWVAVMMMVFGEVHGIEPLTAFLLSAGVNVALRLAQYFLFKTPFLP